MGAILILGVILIIACVVMAPSQKKAEDPLLQSTDQALPQKLSELDFHYSFDGTGYGINAKNGEIFFFENSHSVPTKYTVKQIRDFEKKWITAGQSMTFGNIGVTASVQQAGYNYGLQRQAKKDSGLFVSVADIDHPTWHIRFKDQKSLDQAFEIFSQLLEGRLTPRRVDVEGS